MENWFMKQCCKHCPFHYDTKPFLRTGRAEELAYAAEDEYNTFPCHKTTEEDSEDGEMITTSSSKECAGFMAMQHNLNGNKLPEGFLQDVRDCYGDVWEMIDAYETFNEN